MKKLLFIILVGSLITACGQSGKLSLPKESPLASSVAPTLKQ